MTSPVLNQLYRRVIASNNRLQQLKALGAPDIVVRNEHRILQQAIRELGDTDFFAGAANEVTLSLECAA